MAHYVYKHLNATTGECFYVGIGSSRPYARAYSSKNRNQYWKNYVAKHAGFAVQIIQDNLSKEAACAMEMHLIKCFGKRIDGGQLVNLSDGGENSLYNIPRTAEHSKKIADALRGRKASDESKRKMSTRKKGKPLSAEHIERLRISNTGKKRTAESIERYKISNSRKRRPQSDEHKSKTGIYSLGKIHQKPITCLNNGTTYISVTEAAKALGISNKHISSVCKGTRNQTNGFKFIYA